MGGHISQVHVSIAQLLDDGVGLQRTIGRTDISSVSLRLQVGGEGIQRVLRHPMVQVQVTNTHIGLIVLCHSMIEALELQRTSTLTCDEIGTVMLTVGLQLSLDGYSTRDAIVAPRLGIEHRGEHTHVVGLALDIQLGTQGIQICQVMGIAVGCETEDGGQLDIDTCKFHPL